MVKAQIHITLKNGVLDPQGKAIAMALTSLGFSNVEDVRQGKFIEITLNEDNKDKAETDLTKMCQLLLANNVIENYTIKLL
jgi:phosphoribosylformylglycinamidine synthase